jgi:two-component system chemotaxis sensor kinase CheA
MSVTILLADDHPFVRRGVRNLLEAEEDFSVVGEAEDGLQVVQMAEKLRPDILVVDIMMPNLNGFELVERIRADSRWERLPVIAVTSLAGEEDILRGKHLGFTDYQVKLDRERLLGSLRSHLEMVKNSH